MSFTTAQKEEGTMYKRTFKVLLAASVVALGVPVTAAAMPTDHSGGTVVAQKSAPIVSEKVAGLNPQNQPVAPTATERMTKLRLELSKAPIVSEKAEGFVISHRETATLTKSPIVSEKTAGLNLPTQQQPVERVLVSSNTGFDWGDAGIGAGVMFGSILAAVAAAGTVRRYHGHFAH
jgi:hypothetical protein